MTKKVCVLLTAVLFLVGTAGANFVGPFTPDTSTLALYHLDETSGNAATDASANGNHGTLVGSDISRVPGKYSSNGVQLVTVAGGNAAGEGSAITMPANLLSRAHFTVQMDMNWDYSTTPPFPGDGYMGAIFGGGGSNTFARGWIDTTNSARWQCGLTFGVQTYAGWFQINTAPGAGLTDAWTNVAFTTSWEDVGGGTYNQVSRILFDGEVVAENASPSGAYGGPGTPTIGAANTGGASWGGKIDEVRILNYALDPIPEPVTIALLGLGGLAIARRKNS